MSDRERSFWGRVGGQGNRGRRRHRRPAPRRAVFEMLEERRVLTHVGDGAFIHNPMVVEMGSVPILDPALGIVPADVVSSLTGLPALHSRPGAPASIFLDFDGHFEPVWGGFTNVTTPVFDLDGDTSTFNGTEIAVINSVWQRVSEDYAPFNIDVTTVNPGDFSNGKGLRVAIGGLGDWLGFAAGGVAYIDNFTNAIANTVYVFPGHLSNSEKLIAEASSHEAGHAVGLYHQSTYDSNSVKVQEYNPGSGNWAPIMGNSYSAQVSTWYNGQSSEGATAFQDDMSIIARPLNGFGYRADDHGGTTATASPMTVDGDSVLGGGVIETMTDVDAFTFSTDAGLVTLTANVASLGANLKAVLELYDSFGTLVAQANPASPAILNATISTFVPAGIYTVLVKATGNYGWVGQYSLTGAVNGGLFVEGHTPTEVDVVDTPPTDFDIHFSRFLDSDTIDASDLLVNGVAADSYELQPDFRTVRFHFNTSPVTVEGLQHLEIAAGALQELDLGTLLKPFAGTFRYDPTPLSITTIVPADGSAVTLPMTNLTVHFSQEFAAGSVSASDLLLDRGTVTGFTIIDSSTIDFAIAGLTTEGPLSVQIQAGKLTDLAGNPSLPFAGNLILDVGTVPYPSPLGAVDPLGSQIYDPAVAGTIGFAGDTDSFTLDVPVGQTISVVVEAGTGLKPAVTLLDPLGVAIGTATAPAAGKAEVLNTVATLSGGTYTIVVTGAENSIGSYSAHVLINTAVEESRYGGATNSSRATAQSLDDSFLDVGGGISRGAVLGQSQPPIGPLANESEPNDTLLTADDATRNFLPAVGADSQRYQLGLRGQLQTFGDSDWIRLGTLRAGDRLSLAEYGSGSARGSVGDTYLYLYRGTSASPILVASNDDSGPGADSFIYRFNISTTDEYYLRAGSFSGGTGFYDIALSLEAAGAGPVTGGAVPVESEPNDSAATAIDASTSWRAVQHVSQTSGSLGFDYDYFKYHFTAGDLVSFVAHPSSGLPSSGSIELLNSSGTTVFRDFGESATGVDNDLVLLTYRVPSTGDYYLRTRWFSSPVSYSVRAYLSTDTAPLAPTANDDYYSFTVAAGESVSLALAGLTTGPLHVELQNAAGVVLASGQTGATNLAESTAPWIAPTTGVYYAHVTSNTVADYSLTVNRNAVFDREGNDDPEGPLQSLFGTHGALGSLNANSRPMIGALHFELDPTLSYITLSGTVGPPPRFARPLTEQSPGSLTAHFGGHVLLDRQESTIEFITGSEIEAIDQPGPFAPGDVSADFAMNVIIAGLQSAGVFEHIVIDAVSLLLGPQPVAAAAADGPQLASHVFPANSVIFSLTSGDFSLEIPDTLFTSFDVSGWGQVNQATGNGSLDDFGDHLTLSIPLHFSVELIVPGINAPAELILDGQLVANYEDPGPIDPVDYYLVHLEPGQQLTVSTDTPLDGVSGVTQNTLDASLELLDSLGGIVASDLNSAGDGKNAALSFISLSGGDYRIGVRAQSGVGEYVLHTELSNLAPIADAGGPYTVTKGGGLSLDASLSHDPNPNDLLTYSWDINGDGVFGDASGVSPTLTWAQLETLGIVVNSTYQVQVLVTDGKLPDIGDTTLTTQYSSIEARQIFYNRSAFDGNNPLPNAADDGAIATDKHALLPGETATFANYTSYSRGINGIMIDIAGLPNVPTAADFQFIVGNLGDIPGDWSEGPAPASVSVRQGDGVGGADRVTIIWTDNAIQKQWLFVRVIANDQTGLERADEFYFGNALGDTGSSPTNAKVNATDQIEIRGHQRVAVLNPAPITDPFDINRDRSVNATDGILARRNQTAFDSLRLVTAPVVAFGPGVTLRVAAAQLPPATDGDALSAVMFSTATALPAASPLGGSPGPASLDVALARPALSVAAPRQLLATVTRDLAVRAVASELGPLTVSAKAPSKVSVLQPETAALDDSLLTLLSQNLVRTAGMRPVLRRA